MIRTFGVLLVFFLAASTGCGGGSSSSSGGGGIEASPVSFARDIQPIFDARCTSCHSGSTPAAGLNLSGTDSYSKLVNASTSTPACRTNFPDVVRVKPGDTNGSMLWRKTKPVDQTSRCGNPMPRPTAGLGEIAPDEFAKLEKWIEQGALNN